MIRRILCIVFVILLLISFIPILGSGAPSPINDRESIEIFNGDTATYIRGSIMGSSEVYEAFLSSFLNGSDLDGIERLEIQFIRLLTWRNVYNYFIDGVWYNGTSIKYVPSTLSLVRFIGGPDKNILEGVLYSLSRSLYLAYSRDPGSLINGGYVSPYSHEISFNELKEFIEEFNYAVGKWLKLDSFESYDFYNITFRLHPSDRVGDIIISFIYYDSAGISSYINVFRWFSVKDDPLDINITFYSRFGVFPSYPSGVYNVTVLDEQTIYIKLSGTVRGNGTINPFDVDNRYSIPIIKVYRELNNTNPGINDVIEVILKVENIGDVDARDLTIEEYTWWDNSSIIFIDGDTSRRIGLLLSGGSEILKYRVRINTSKSFVVDMGKANATLVIDGGIRLVYGSGTMILPINMDLPVLDLDIEMDKFEPSVSEELEVDIIVKNIGGVKAENIRVGKYIIGDLEVGEERIIRDEVVVEGVLDVLKTYFIEAEYYFNESSYLTYSPDIKILFKPRDIIGPSAFILSNYEVTNGNLSISILINNIGLTDITNLDVSGIYDANLYKFISGNFTLVRDGLLISNGLVIGKGGSIRLEANFTILKNNISLYPVFQLRIGDTEYTLRRLSNIDVSYNGAILYDFEYPRSPILIGSNYTVKLNILNRGDVGIHNLTLAFTSTEGLNISVSPNLTRYIPPNSGESLYITLYADQPGIYEVESMKLLFIIGSKREILIGSFNLTFMAGLKPLIDFSIDRVIEGGSSELIIILDSDCFDCISDIELSIHLPYGLIFSDGGSNYSLSIPTLSGRKEIRLEVNAINPGEYIVSNITLKYKFIGLEVDATPINIKEGRLVLIVSEDVVSRYYIYFVIVLIFTIIVSIYIRKII